MVDKRLVFLTIRAQTGDRSALDGLLREVQGGLFRLILSVVVDEAVAADVLQEVLILIVRKLRWLSDPRAVRAWSSTIARREAVRAVKRRGREVERATAFAHEGEVTTPVESGPDRVALERAMNDVPDASRRVLELHYEGDLTIAEIARRLGIPRGTVKSRLAYGLDAFRKALKGRRLTKEDVW